MLTALVVVLFSADPPRYIGGAEPTPLRQPAEPDRSPSIQACTFDTLRTSTGCFFDSQPIQNDTDAAKKKQAKTNLDLATALGASACERRALPSGIDAKERRERISSCAARVAKAAEVSCSLDGVEALLDAEGRFAKSARQCYGDLAAALQSGDVPNPVRSEQPDTAGSSHAKPIKI
jgi:hypothetical protein